MSRLVEHREKLNLTQEELSEKSGISVRTIQRIESGKDPKGHTLKTLAKTLDIKEANLLNMQMPKEHANYTIINIINLSSLFVAFIPIVNFTIPLLIALLKKQLNSVTKKIITIQVVWAFTMIAMFLIGLIINLGDFGRDLMLGILLFLILVNVFVILRNSMELKKNHKLYFSLKNSII